MNTVIAEDDRAHEYLPLVRKVAERMARRLPPVVDVSDLIGAGTLGLLDAVQKYDPARCDRFAAYAEIRIRGAILDQLRTMDWMPRSVRFKGTRLDRALTKLSQALGRKPESAEMAAYLGMSDAAYEQTCVDARGGVFSTEDLGDEGSATLADERPEPHTQVAGKELRARLSRALTRLPERERQVLSLYYVEELKLKEIGEVFGVTESRVCQLHSQAVARLRGILAAEETA